MSKWEQLYRHYRQSQRPGQQPIKPPFVGPTEMYRDRSEPFDDVYHAALSIIYSNYHHGVRWIPSPDYSLVFRGQRAEWPVIPKLYRGANSSANIQNEASRVTKFVRHLQSIIPGLHDEQGVAVAQHYSDEANVKTWLVDVTWDPFVALFFASLGGRDGDLGVVWSVPRQEWEQLSAGGANRLGTIHIISVPNVHRINAQRAAFINTSHPDLFEQFVAYTIWFRQKAGLTFEDPYADPPLTSNALLPNNDPLVEIVHATEVPELPTQMAPLNVAPHPDGVNHLKGADYLAIAESWWKSNRWTLDTSAHRHLTAVCEFHTRVQDLRDQIDIELRSLRRLEEASQALRRAQGEGEAVTLKDVLGSIFSRISKHDVQYSLLQKVVQQVEQQVGW